MDHLFVLFFTKTKRLFVFYEITMYRSHLGRETDGLKFVAARRSGRSLWREAPEKRRISFDLSLASDESGVRGYAITDEVISSAENCKVEVRRYWIRLSKNLDLLKSIRNIISYSFNVIL